MSPLARANHARVSLAAFCLALVSALPVHGDPRPSVADREGARAKGSSHVRSEMMPEVTRVLVLTIPPVAAHRHPAVTAEDSTILNPVGPDPVPTTREAGPALEPAPVIDVTSTGRAGKTPYWMPPLIDSLAFDSSIHGRLADFYIAPQR